MTDYKHKDGHYIPVGTVVQIMSLEDKTLKHIVGNYATILQEGKVMKDAENNKVIGYPSNVIVNNVRQCFTFDAFNVMQYPPHYEQWLKTKMDFLTQPLNKCDDCVKNFIGDNPYIKTK